MRTPFPHRITSKSSHINTSTVIKSNITFTAGSRRASAHIHSKTMNAFNCMSTTPQSQMPRFLGRSDLWSDPLHISFQLRCRQCRRMCQNLCKQRCFQNSRLCNSIQLAQCILSSMMPGWGLRRSLSSYSRTRR